MAARRYFKESTLTRLRETPAADALALLAIHIKADPSYRPIKSDQSRRWHVRTTQGEFEILTTGCQWYDMRGRCGGGGAIDLAMHVCGLSFVNAVNKLIRELSQNRSDYS
ncbi:MAG: hypothetical protein F4181_16435 [Proteobacteria bacterium]|nr:hypothetical protein [Pseudomonadota bacterium]